MLVALTTVTAVAAVPPNVTVAPEANPVPVIVTAVPPAVVPDFGEIELIVTPVVTVIKASLELVDPPRFWIWFQYFVVAVSAGVV